MEKLGVFDVSNFEQALRNLDAYWSFLRNNREKIAEVNLDAVQDGLATILVFCRERFDCPSAMFDAPEEDFYELVDAALVDAYLK
jgi:hypothetical protein